ncbi:MAG: caspase family protein [Anaerolineae bacterium]|nr:caspase family protein [Anaerolineae bacterium]
MSKKALCVGINDYPLVGNDLRGCVNDANAWAKLLIDHYNFASSDVKIILDKDATKVNVIAALKDLLKGAAPGDVLVFTNSSHGSYEVSKDSDEKYDELLCPYDIDQSQIIDDELRELFSGVPQNVKLSVVLDNCFSGSGTKLPLMDLRPRFLPPSVLGKKELINPFLAKPNSAGTISEEQMHDILLSGCRDNEFSFDGNFGGTNHGALTFCAMEAIKKAKYKITYEQLHRRVNLRLSKMNVNQHPQLEGKSATKKSQIFV